jgi:hypothetical protein
VGEWVYGRKGTSLRRESVTGTCGGGRNEKKKKKLGRMYKKKNVGKFSVQKVKKKKTTHTYLQYVSALMRRVGIFHFWLPKI